MTIKIKEEIGHLQPPDQNQPDKDPSPRAKPHHGPPDKDAEEDDEDLYGREYAHWLCRHALQTNKGSTSTGGARQRSPPTPIVPPRPPLPSCNPPAPRKPSMGYKL